MDTADARQELLARIGVHRQRVTEYLADARPRSNRLSLTAIVSSAVAAACTAGPAFGGQGFAVSTANVLSISSTSAIWQVLCFAALVVSVVSAIAVNLNSNAEAGSRLVAAETCNAELEGLQTLLEFNEIGVGEAVRGFHAAVAKIAFVPPAR